MNHIQATTITKNGNKVEYRHDLNFIKSIFKQADDSNILFVIFVGSYGIGKTSKIMKLLYQGTKTQFSISKTYGVQIHGPVSYNDLCKRFHCSEEMLAEDAKLYFIDTEGLGFISDESQEIQTLLMSQFIAPYAALANIIVTTSECNVVDSTVKSMEQMIDIFQKVRSVGNFNEPVILNIINDCQLLKEGEDNCNAKNQINGIFVKRSSQIYNNTFPLPPFNEHGIFYNSCFADFAKELISKLKDCNNSKSFKGNKEAFFMFKHLIEKTDGQGLDDVINDAYKATKQDQNNYSKKIIEQLISDEIKSVESIYNDVVKNLKENEIINARIIDKESIISKIINSMESFPKYVKNDMNADKVKQEISNQVEQWQNKIDEEVGNKQKDFIVQKTKTKLSEIMDNSSFSKDPQIIKDEVDKFINDNYYKNYKISESSKEKIKYEVDQLIQSEFEKYITNTYDFDQISNEIIKTFQKTHKKNIINIQINKLIVFQNYNENSIINDAKTMLKSKIPYEITDFQVLTNLFKKIEKEIKQNLIKSFQDEINKAIKENKLNFIYKRIKDKLDSICKDYFAKIQNQTCNYEEILSNNLYDEIKTIIFNEVFKIIDEYDFIIDEEIKNKIDDNIKSAYASIQEEARKIDMVSANCKGNKKIKSIEIPNGTSVIERYAFEGCLSLERVIIPVSVIRIEYGAFQNCYSLVNIIIPGSVIEIGDWAFRGCSNLEKIEIKGEVINIGDFAFYKCMRLKDIIVPNGFDLNKLTIGSSSFCGCTSLNDMIKSKIEELNPNALKTQSNYCCYNYLQGIK